MKVSPIMLLKTHIEKMPETGHATICMKIIHLEDARHYVDQNKTCYSKLDEIKAIDLGGARACVDGLGDSRNYGGLCASLPPPQSG